MLLNATQVRKLKPKDKPFKRANAGELHLYVTPKGSRLWRLRYRFDGNLSDLVFGRQTFVTIRTSIYCISKADTEINPPKRCSDLASNIRRRFMLLAEKKNHLAG